MPQAGHTFAHLFCEMEGRVMQTIKKEKNREFQKECGGVKNSTLSGGESAKRQTCSRWSTASINIVGTGTVGGT